MFSKYFLSESFYAIYDFSLESGDTVTMPFASYQVSSTGVIDIGGTSRRYQIVNFIGGPTGHMIIEGIGMVGQPHLNEAFACSWLFPDADFCSLPVDGQNYYFRCFAGSGLYYSPYNNCTLATSLNDWEPESVSLYPNPATDWLTLETGSRVVALVEIFDLMGRKIWQGEPVEGTIDCRAMENGVYLVQMTDRHGGRLSKLVAVLR